MKKVAIIGGGISGLMAAGTLCQNPDVHITVFEQGKNLENRSCPILKGTVNKCIKCTNCGITEGLAGAGAFSDGKFNITSEFGGWLQDIIGGQRTIEYIEKVDNILKEFGAPEKRYMPDNELKKQCIQNGLYMLQSECKHFGTDGNLLIMQKFINELSSYKNIEFLTNHQVIRVEKSEYGLDNKLEVTYYPTSRTVDLCDALFDVVIFAVGRVGSGFFHKWCKQHNIKQYNNQIDIGVRVELPAIIWEHIDQKVYDPKILYRTKQYNDICRTFCFNPRGEVVNENSDGVITVNGHAYEGYKTDSSNFSLLSTINFTEPFTEPVEYARYVAGLANMISGGSVIVQTLGDLENGRRSTPERLKKSITKQTLNTAIAGDLGLCMPKRQLDNIIETLHALDTIAPGTANSDTLLYGVECKYYSARPETTQEFNLIDYPNVYAIGDGAGFTRSLAQAGAQGILVGENILKGI